MLVDDSVQKSAGARTAGPGALHSIFEFLQNKGMRPWLFGAAAIVAIELSILAFFPSQRAERTNFLHLDFASGETVQRAIAYLKLKDLSAAPAEILQVGDSSGMHAIVPALMTKQLGGPLYRNMNVATTLGYVGYYNIAKYVLEQQSRPGTIKALVLYTNLFGGQPREMLWADKKLIGHDVGKEFNDPFYRLFQIPSLGKRQSVSHEVLYWGAALKLRDAPLADNDGYRHFQAVYRFSDGWVRENDVPGDVPHDIWANLIALQQGRRPADMPDEMFRMVTQHIPQIRVESFFDWSKLKRVTYMEDIYGRFADLARSHGAKLYVVFNPLPESSRRFLYRKTANGDESGILRLDEITAELERLKSVFKDVYFQTEYDFWPDERFSVFSHLETPAAVAGTHALADRLKADLPKFGNPAAAPRQYPRTVTVDFARPFGGYGWAHDNALAGAWIGRRDAAALWARVQPGGTFKIEIEIASAQAAAVEELALYVNDTAAIEKRVSPDGQRVSWTVPAEAIEKWDGWLMVTLATATAPEPSAIWSASRPLSDGKKVAVKRLSISPAL